MSEKTIERFKRYGLLQSEFGGKIIPCEDGEYVLLEDVLEEFVEKSKVEEVICKVEKEEYDGQSPTPRYPITVPEACTKILKELGLEEK